MFVSPLGFASAASAFGDPVAIAAGVGVGVSSSVIPYVFDQLAMARLPRATYALFIALLPATATVIGVVVLRQFPSALDLAGIGLIMVGVVLHRPEDLVQREPRRERRQVAGLEHGARRVGHRLRGNPRQRSTDAHALRAGAGDVGE